MADRDIVYRYGYEGLDQLAAKVTETGDKAEASHKKILGSSKEAGAGLEALSTVSERAQEKMREMSGEAGLAGDVLAKLGPIGLAAGAALGVFAAGLTEALKAAAEDEVSIARFNAVLAATGQASGKTTEQLNGLAEALATTTLATKDQAEQAAAQLLTFRSVSGEVFDETLKLAQDLAATGFGGLAENAVKLGRVLEQPTANLDSLRRVGIQFNDETKERIDLLEKEGRHFEAQQVILDEIAKKVGGSGAAQGDTLVGAWHAFGQQFSIAMETIGARTGLLPVLASGVREVTGALREMSKSDLQLAIDQLAHLESGELSGGARENSARATAHGETANAERIKELKDYIEHVQAGQKAEEAAAEGKAYLAHAEDTLSAARVQANSSLQKAHDLAAKIAQEDADAAAAAEKKRQDLISALTIEADAKQRVTDATMLGRDALDAMNLELEIEANLRKLGNDASPAEIQAVVDKTAATSAATIALRNYNEELEKQKQAEEKAQREAEKAAKAIQRQLEDQAKAAQKFAQETGTQIVDAFINMAEGAKKPFDSLLAYAKRTFEQMVAAALLNPIIVPVVASFIGGAGGAGGGIAGVAGTGSSLLSLGGQAGVFGAGGLNLAGAIDTLGYNYLGIGGTVSSGGIMGGATPFLSSYLGAGALGGVGGYLIGSLTGMKNPSYSGIGGGVGAMAGLAVGGPVGAAVGALIGSLAGLLGPGPSDKLQGDWINFDTGNLSTYGYTGNKYSAENASSASALAKSLLDFKNVLSTSGLEGNYAGNARVEVGSREAPYRVWYGGLNGDTSAGQFSTAQDAFKAMAQQLLGSLTDVPAGFQKIIDRIDWNHLEKFAQDLQDLAAYQTALASVRDQIAQIEDPKKYALDQLDKQFQPLRDMAATTGEGLADIEKLYGLKRQQILQQFGESSLDATKTFMEKAWAGMNAAEGHGFLNAIQSAVRDHTQGLSDADKYGTGKDWVDRTFVASLHSIIEAGNLTADELKVIAATFANIPEVVAAANRALASITAPAIVAPVQEVVGDWAQILSDLFTQQIDGVQAQIDAAKELEGVWNNIRDGLQQARNGLLVDSNLSPLSLEQRTVEAKRQFDDAFQKAMGGDAGAAAQLGDLARAFLTADMAFQHGNAQYAADFESIMGKLGQAQQYAGQQVTIEQLQLNALNGILSALTSGRAAATGAGAKPAGYNAADGAALTAAYGAAKDASGLSDADFLATSAGSVWVQARDNLIGGTTDPNLLYQDLAAARAQKGQDGMQAIGASYEAKVISQLSSLGIAVPQYDTGGYVNRTGLAMVHQNEYVLRPGEAAGINETLAAIKGELASLRAVVTVYAERDLAASAEICANTGAAASAPADALVLAATSARTRTVG